jgi:hypothetical protein
MLRAENQQQRDRIAKQGEEITNYDYLVSQSRKREAAMQLKGQEQEKMFERNMQDQQRKSKEEMKLYKGQQ